MHSSNFLHRLMQLLRSEASEWYDGDLKSHDSAELSVNQLRAPAVALTADAVTEGSGLIVSK